MRYWVCAKGSKTVLGPYPPKRIMGMAGFAPDWRVAPAGSTTREAWVRVQDVPEFQALMSPPQAGEAPKPAPGAAPLFPPKKPA